MQCIEAYMNARSDLDPGSPSRYQLDIHSLFVSLNSLLPGTLVEMLVLTKALSFPLPPQGDVRSDETVFAGSFSCWSVKMSGCLKLPRVLSFDEPHGNCSRKKEFLRRQAELKELKEEMTT